jgi:small redox-active disulfide protein 2
MKVTVYGPGCARCQKTAEVVEQTLSAHGIPVELEKVTDYAVMAAAGVMSTPGVALDGKLVSTGKLPSVAEIESWLV